MRMRQSHHLSVLYARTLAGINGKRVVKRLSVCLGAAKHEVPQEARVGRLVGVASDLLDDLLIVPVGACKPTTRKLTVEHASELVGILYHGCGCGCGHVMPSSIFHLP